jgi:Tol biopolymer transport system component/imidazolonepropionase-like amidohydrolase
MSGMRVAAVGIVAVAVFGAGLGGQPASRDVRLTLSEGTSMSASLSPDGRTVAIDLLGALWTYDAGGGPARRILEDGYDARLPVWSPDGRRLAFQAYHRDTWHVWVIGADGTGLQQITYGPFDDREPFWSPDGTRLTFSSDRSGHYDIWIATLASGEVSRLTSAGSNESMPAWSPDGREIAFVSDRPERGVYAQPVAGGAERRLALDATAVAAPAWAPDAKSIAYATTAGSTTRLMVNGKNVADAAEDVFPFRPQFVAGGDVLYAADGVVKRRPLAGGPARTLAFTAEVAFTRAPFTPRGRRFDDSAPQPVRGLMHPAISPDGSRIAFAALGDLWLVPATEGSPSPQRLTQDVFVETNPVWSPDGQEIAYSSDRDGAVALWIRDLRSGADRRVAPEGTTASWSPDGRQLAFLDTASTLRVVDVASREARQAHDRIFEPGRPSWSPDGRAVVMSALRPYSTRFREGTNQVLWVAVAPDTSAAGKGAFPADRWFDPVPHQSVGMRENFGPVWAPNGREMAAIVDGSLTTFPVARDGTPVGPSRRITEDLASSPSWTADSRRILYQVADRFRLVTLADGSVRDITPSWTWTPRRPSGTTTVHAGRLFDGRAGEGLRTGVDIVIEGARITAVTPHRDDLHRGAVVDAAAATVLPGLIESHAHLSKALGEAQGRIFLSFGVTAVRNPAANAFEGQEEREAIESGVRIGPRVFTTGEPLDGTRIYYPGGVGLDGGARVEALLERAATLRFDFIKTYVRLPDLLQKRVIEGAHRAGMPVTSHEIYPAVAYGADGVEHIRGTSRRGFIPKNSELRRSYADVLQLLTASGMTLTPTIGIQGGNQLLTLKDGAWIDDPRMKLFPASTTAGARELRAKPVSAPDLAAREALVAAQERFTAAVVKGGGRVIAGTDSPIIPYGMALLMEMEHYARGGMPPAEVIRSATAVAAEAMGLGADLGTIEAGKLADLVIVDGDPLTAITDLRKTRTVIKDGEVFEVSALLAGPVRR